MSNEQTDPVNSRLSSFLRKQSRGSCDTRIPSEQDSHPALRAGHLLGHLPEHPTATRKPRSCRCLMLVPRPCVPMMPPVVSNESFATISNVFFLSVTFI